MFSNNLLMGAASISAGGYEVDYSCRFNPDDNTYLVSTLGTPSSTTAFTMSTWVKRGALGDWTAIYSSYKGSGSGDRSSIYFRGSDGNALTVTGEEGASTPLQKNTTQLFRDPNAWQHIVISFDLTASSSTYCRLYINGSQVTSFSTDTVPSADQALAWNRDGYTFTVGCDAKTLAGDDFDGYLSQTCLIDGQTLTASSFGETNSSGVWVPIDITGLTFGNNGFLLDYADSSDLGNDVSGNSNDFTSSGLATNDQVTDTPTNNFPTWSPIYPGGANCQFHNGNLECGPVGSGNRPQDTNVIFPDSGEYWLEFTVTVRGSSVLLLGLRDQAGNYIRYESDGTKNINGSSSSYGATFQQGDRIGCHVDVDDDIITFYKNGSTQGSITSTPFASVFTAGGVRVYMHGNDTTDVVSINYGQLGFTDTPPDSSVALCTTNLAVPTVTDGSANFQAMLWSGNSSTKTVTMTGNSSFTPDVVWIKSRSDGNGANTYDSSRSSGTSGIALYDTGTPDDETDMGSWGDGTIAFTGGGASGDINATGSTYAAWTWLEDAAPGMSVVASISHDADTPTNIAHGLSAVPEFAWVRATSTTGGGYVYHKDLTSQTDNYLFLNSEADEADLTDAWGTQTSTNLIIDALPSATYVAYIWAGIEGFSSFGSYIGVNSADGPLVITGFKPAFVILKNLDNTGEPWLLFDDLREGYNGANDYLKVTETTEIVGNNFIDLLANGFKVRYNDRAVGGGSSNETVLYMAWAKNPFGGHGGTFGGGVAPATAR